jgi:hypothetical protein
MNPTFLKLSGAQMLALTLYGECRGESTEGKIAVASVILERVDKQSWFGLTILSVCLKPLQFSCFNPDNVNYPKLLHISEHWDETMEDDSALKACWTIALGLLSGNIPRTPEIAAKHCVNYMTPAARDDVSWDDRMAVIATIGGHIFLV